MCAYGMFAARARIVAGFLVIASALAHALAPSVKIFGRRGLAVAGALAAVGLASQRDFWLGFLGPAAFPAKVLTESTPRDATAAVRVDVGRGADAVVYWAASASADNPRAAYAAGDNAGVARAVAGKALLRLRCPGRYAVAGRPLDAHVHYRVASRGMLGPVRTARVECAPAAVAAPRALTAAASADSLGGHAAFAAAARP